jgi:hypothetical protein
MSKVIREFRKVLDIYSDCDYCGAVIASEELRKPDILNPGRFRAMCPSCCQETSRVPFPPASQKQIFELMTELAELNKHILVMVLIHVAHEILVSSFTLRLLERKHCPPDINFAVVDSMEFRGKLRLIKELTGKSLKQLAKEFGFKHLYEEFKKLKTKRNAFIHEGVLYKLISTPVGTCTVRRKAELDEKDLKQAIGCAEKMVHFFAQLFTKYGKYEQMYDE